MTRLDETAPFFAGRRGRRLVLAGGRVRGALASEQLYFMTENPPDGAQIDAPMRRSPEAAGRSQSLAVNFAKKLIQNGEFHRAKFVLTKLKRQTPVEHFLFYFSWYMICLRKKAELGAEDEEHKEEAEDETFLELNKDIERFYRKSPDTFDSFLLYLLGQIRRDSQLYREAKQCLMQAVELEGRCWPAWNCLVSLVQEADLTELDQRLPEKTWHFNLFTAETAARLQMLKLAKDYFNDLRCSAFGDTPYMLSSTGAVNNSLQENRSAIECFDRVRKIDPFRIEHMNLYSDSLFILGEELELSQLADAFNQTHKFVWETCCIMANYYSIRGLHDKAIDFLKRAIRLRPDDAQVWILLGHEYLHTKNQQGAILAYRRATSVDSRSFRAWYGLGQLYEILKLPAYALYYYQQAVRCKPTDSRMLIATGVVLAKLQRYDDSEKCYKKAFQIGDVEGNALTHLGSLYQELQRHDQAAKAYEQYLKLYCDEEKDCAFGDDDTIAACCQFLAEYYQTKGQLDKANEYAHRCLLYEKSKDFGGQLLRSLKVERASGRKSSEKDARAANTPSSSQGFVPVNRTAAARSPRTERPNDSEVAPTSPENVEEDMSVDEESGADYSF
ncbi:hypothetical protein M3Y99_00067700 [Aphelenchoides fujianensis]|nr:hypothetical protein M3Y99_00067700 [Aphelenchoides fujianensis]